MKKTLTASLIVLVSGCSAASQADSQFNDTATGVRLMNERPLMTGTPAERVVHLAECSGTLLTAARQTPPPDRAARMEELAERLLRLAVRSNEVNASGKVDVVRLRDEAMAANLHLAERLPQQFGGWLAQSAEACGRGSLMTDEELTVPRSDEAAPTIQ